MTITQSQEQITNLVNHMMCNYKDIHSSSFNTFCDSDSIKLLYLADSTDEETKALISKFCDIHKNISPHAGFPVLKSILKNFEQ